MSNRTAFLTMIAVSEGTADGENDYNIIVGSTARQLITFSSFADHPRLQVWLPSLNLRSDAAGRYQIIARYFDVYRRSLHLADFGPASQDAIAVQMITECHALDDVDSGRFAVAVSKVRSRWASLPNAGYAQHENTLISLQTAYLKAGGALA